MRVEVDNSSYLSIARVSLNTIIFLTKIAGTMELRIGVTMYLVCRLPIGTRLPRLSPFWLPSLAKVGNVEEERGGGRSLGYKALLL